MLKHKAAHGSGVDPSFPDGNGIESSMRGYPSDHWVNIYGDGSYTSPTLWWAALGGYGIWMPEWPQPSQDDQCDTLGQDHTHGTQVQMLQQEPSSGSSGRNESSSSHSVDFREGAISSFGSRNCSNSGMSSSCSNRGREGTWGGNISSHPGVGLDHVRTLNALPLSESSSGIPSLPEEDLRQQPALRETTSYHGPAIGQTGTSTRQELTAWITVLTIPCRSCYATDSASVFNKALRLIKAAEEKIVEDSMGASIKRGNPFKKPWGLQVDGDLWEQAW